MIHRYHECKSIRANPLNSEELTFNHCINVVGGLSCWRRHLKITDHLDLEALVHVINTLKLFWYCYSLKFQNIGQIQVQLAGYSYWYLEWASSRCDYTGRDSWLVHYIEGCAALSCTDVLYVYEFYYSKNIRVNILSYNLGHMEYW